MYGSSSTFAPSTPLHILKPGLRHIMGDATALAQEYRPPLRPESPPRPVAMGRRRQSAKMAQTIRTVSCRLYLVAVQPTGIKRLILSPAGQRLPAFRILESRATILPDQLACQSQRLRITRHTQQNHGSRLPSGLPQRRGSCPGQHRTNNSQILRE